MIQWYLRIDRNMTHRDLFSLVVDEIHVLCQLHQSRPLPIRGGAIRDVGKSPIPVFPKANTSHIISSAPAIRDVSFPKSPSVTQNSVLSILDPCEELLAIASGGDVIEWVVVAFGMGAEEQWVGDVPRLRLAAEGKSDTLGFGTECGRLGGGTNWKLIVKGFADGSNDSMLLWEDEVC